MTDGGRRFALEADPGRDLELELEQIHSRRRLGDGVLHLQPGVHLHEREQVLVGLVEELDRCRALVPGPQREPDSRVAQLSLAMGGEHRAS